MLAAGEIQREHNLNVSDHYFDLMKRMVNSDINARIDVEASLGHPLFDNIRNRFSSIEHAWRVGDDVAPHEELQESVDARRFLTKYDIYNDTYEKCMTKPVRFIPYDQRAVVRARAVEAGAGAGVVGV